MLAAKWANINHGQTSHINHSTVTHFHFVKVVDLDSSYVISGDDMEHVPFGVHFERSSCDISRDRFPLVSID